jgi:hypothetical protein
MRWPFGNLPSRWAVFAVPPLIALVIGIAVAIASSPASLTGARGGRATTVSGGPSPSPADSSPLPSVTSSGVLGNGARLVVGGSGVLIGLAPNLVEESSDGGKRWTSLRPLNQDIGIVASETIQLFPTVAQQPEGWKESGGFAGTFSPNAAFEQTVLSLTGGTPYAFELVWKTNIPTTSGTIHAGAGPIGGKFSPTRLTLQPIAC